MSVKRKPWSEEQKKAWSDKCKLLGANRRKTPITSEQLAENSRRQTEHNKTYWTPERRAEQSARMKQKVMENPDSYSKSNVSGRVRMYEIQDSHGPTRVKGT